MWWFHFFCANQNNLRLRAFLALDEEQERSHIFRGIADDVGADFMDIMAVDGPASHRYFEIEMTDFRRESIMRMSRSNYVGHASRWDEARDGPHEGLRSGRRCPHRFTYDRCALGRIGRDMGAPMEGLRDSMKVVRN